MARITEFVQDDHF
jgi:plastocyanin